MAEQHLWRPHKCRAPTWRLGLAYFLSMQILVAPQLRNHNNKDNNDNNTGAVPVMALGPLMAIMPLSLFLAIVIAILIIGLIVPTYFYIPFW